MYAGLTKWCVLVGLLAASWAQAADCQMRCGAYSMELLDESGQLLPTFEHEGRSFVLGAQGQRYLVRIHNYSGRRIEVVGSVDGRDVIDGQSANWDKRGYIVAPYQDVTIDGFRLNEQSVAAFRFSTVSRSYAAQMGDAREVGVIGVAVFGERLPPPIVFRPPPPHPYAHEPSNAGAGTAGDPAPAPPSSAADVPSAQAPQQRSFKSEERPGLGTEFGEEHTSQVYTTRFDRASSRPEAMMRVNYNDRQGLIAMGIELDRRPWRADDSSMRWSAEPFPRNESFSQPPPGWRP